MKKLNEELFVDLLEKIRKNGPDDDCKVDVHDMMIPAAKEFVLGEVARIGEAGTVIALLSSLSTSFHIGFEMGLQYAKTMKDVDYLERMMKEGKAK